jgi:hypothetical protein
MIPRASGRGGCAAPFGTITVRTGGAIDFLMASAIPPPEM